MKKAQYIEILNLSQSVFNDSEYNFVKKCIVSKNFNKLRLFIDEKLEFLEATSTLYTNDQVLQGQIAFCSKLDDIIMDLTIENLV